MEWNRKNIKTVALLIAGGIFFYWLLQNFAVAGLIINTILGLLAPFIFGLMIAFVLNVPMRAIENTLFGRAKASGKKKFLLKISRPISFLLTLLCLLAALALLLFIVIPEIGRTFELLSPRIPEFFQQAEKWLNSFALQWPTLSEYLVNLELAW